MSENAIDSGEIIENTDSIEGSDEGEEIETPVIPERKRVSAIKVKFNGKESEEKLPFEIDEEHADWMREQIQKAKLSASKGQEYANLEKENKALMADVQAFFQELKTNPKKALSNPMFGVDIKNLAAQVLEDELAEQEKSPEQREKEKLQARLQELEDERKKEKEEAESAKYQATLERAYEKYDNMLESTLKNNTDLPQTPYIVEKMTKYMSFMVEDGTEPDMEIIANQVRTEMESDIKHLLTILPVDKVEAILGAEVLSKLRKNRLAKAPSKVVPPTIKSQVKDVATKTKKEEAKPAEKQTMRSFFGV